MTVYLIKTDEGDIVRLTWECTEDNDTVESPGFEQLHTSKVISGTLQVEYEEQEAFTKTSVDGAFTIPTDTSFLMTALEKGKMECDYPKAAP